MTASEEAKPIGKRVASGRVWLVYDARRDRGDGVFEHMLVCGDAIVWRRRDEFEMIDRAIVLKVKDSRSWDRALRVVMERRKRP